MNDCEHPKTTVYQVWPGWSVRECLLCGRELDAGRTADFQRGHATTVGGFTPPDAVAGGEAVGGLPAR